MLYISLKFGKILAYSGRQNRSLFNFHHREDKNFNEGAYWEGSHIHFLID
jgi:hypothetical protein